MSQREIDFLYLVTAKPFEDVAAREAWAGATRLDLAGLTHDVSGPGIAVLNAAGDRAPRAAAATGGLEAAVRDNWMPTGPRNIGGRIRALAVDPNDDDVWYAGSASGGPYKSINRGASWFPLMHDEPSLAVGRIAVAPSDSNFVYLATGEIRPAGLNVRGHGIWVSEDAGANFDNHGVGVPKPANPAHTHGFDGLAVDPAEPRHCWAVGKDGIFRTVDAGRAWQRFEPGVYFSDVAYLSGRLFLVRGTSQGGEAAVIRLPSSRSGAAVSEADVAAAIADAANLSRVMAPVADHVAWPARGKIAFHAAAPLRAFVRFVDEDGGHSGLFRATNSLTGSAAAINWQRLPDHFDWVTERQGLYNLTLAVDPADRNRVATGMVLVHTSRNADNPNAEFRRAMAWWFHDAGLRAHHADQHQKVVSNSELWAANDGGIMRSTNWATGEEVFWTRPIDADGIRWERRDHGITAAQMYDLNQSPLVPGMHAAGMQDNSVHLSAGGPTWRMVSGGDGGFVAFDADDPYRFKVTSQNDISAAQFPGHLDPFVLGEQPPGPISANRTLEEGFERVDDPAFVADTDQHPLDAARLLHIRRNRLYGSRPATGERWRPEPVGTGFELIYEVPGLDAELEILPTDGAIRLGLVPMRRTRHVRYEPLTHPERRSAMLTARSRLPGPYRLDGDVEVAVKLNGAEHRVTIAAGDVADVSAVTVIEVARILDGGLPTTVRVLPQFWAEPLAVEISTREVGSTQTIELGGTLLAPLGDGLSRLGLNAGSYTGADDQPASLSLGHAGWDEDERGINRDLSSGGTLTISINGGPARDVALDAAGFPDPSHITAEELAAAIRTALAGDEADVVAAGTLKAVLLEASPGHTLLVTGTAADRLGTPTIEGDSVVLWGRSRTERHRKHHARNFNSVDLSPAGPDELTMQFTDGSTTTSDLVFTAADVGDLRSVTIEELYRLIRDHLAAHPGIEIRASMPFFYGRTQPGELRFSTARPGEAWVGGRDGRLFRTTNDLDWSEIPTGDLRGSDRGIEAIALHPEDPSVAYVGMWGPDRVGHRPALFRTGDAGSSWTPATGIEADGVNVGVFAIEVDPDEPGHVYAGTEAGVFRSTNDGAAWEPFNEGLPNTSARDLALVPGTRMLRVAAWGRGAFRRSLDRPDARDVELFLRVGESDDGTGRPAFALNDLLADAPVKGRPASPDIKYVQRRPPALGADDQIDGVEFDLEIPIDPVVAGQSGELLIQVHNRGAFTATDVRLIVLHGPVQDGSPPPLPDSFWTDVAAGSISGAHGDWTVLRDHTVGRDMTPGGPLVEPLDVTWPAALTGPAVAVLAIVQASEDEIDRAAFTVDELLAGERRVAYRELPVHTAADDQTLFFQSFGPRGFQLGAPEGFEGSDVSAVLHIDGTMSAPPAPPRTPVVTSLRASAPEATFNLSGANPAIRVYDDEVIVPIVFTNADNDFADLSAATPFEVARFIQPRLRAAGAAAVIWAPAVGIRIFGRGGATVSPTGGGARTEFGWAAGHVPELTAADANRFDLRGNKHLVLEVSGHTTHTIDIRFDERHFFDARRADPRQIALLANRALADAQLGGLVGCEPIAGIAMAGEFDGTFELDGADAAILGLTPGTARRFERGWPGAPMSLVGKSFDVKVRNAIAVRFDRFPHLLGDATRAALRPSEVRNVINTHLELARMYVRATVGAVNLHVRAVATSGTAAAVPPSSRFEGHVAASNATMEGGDTNLVYVEVANDGGVDAVGAEHRLIALDLAVSPVGRTVLPVETIDVPAGAVEYVEFAFDAPDDVDGVWLLATSNLDLPATDWASPDEAYAWVAAHRNAVLRRFAVVAP
jgi:photosystem II stability/assembly factor-like uncharacterized protein